MRHNWQLEWGDMTESNLGEKHFLGPGDFIEVPAGTLQSAEVIGNEPIESFDATRSAHSPRIGGP